MPYIHNFKEQTHLTANCFNKINFQTISSITIDFYIVSSYSSIIIFLTLIVKICIALSNIVNKITTV